MSINEVFPNPTVKQVIFQIRFPNLFYVEDFIGQYQQRIMKEFPESEMQFRRHVVFAELGPEARVEDVAELKGEPTKKIWRFKSPNHVVLNVLTDSLDLASGSHKTYNNAESGHRFRDAISFAVEAFLELSGVPLLLRVGLRYVDECPVVRKESGWFKEWYNTSLCLARFPVEDCEEMQSVVRIKRGDFMLRYSEVLKEHGDEHKLILDFDGYTTNVQAENCMAVTDSLHDVIVAEYEETIKEPVFEYMRHAKGKAIGDE